MKIILVLLLILIKPVPKFNPDPRFLIHFVNNGNQDTSLTNTIQFSIDEVCFHKPLKISKGEADCIYMEVLDSGKLNWIKYGNFRESYIKNTSDIIFNGGFYLKLDSLVLTIGILDYTSSDMPPDFYINSTNSEVNLIENKIRITVNLSSKFYTDSSFIFGEKIKAYLIENNKLKFF